MSHYYWDSCIFIAYLNDEEESYGALVDHIGQYLDEAKRGLCRIYCSTLTLAEITGNYLKKTEFGSFRDFLENYEAAVTQITPDPNIMALAGQLRGVTYSKDGGRRKLLTPDAIHIASAVTIRDAYKVPLTALHTFDMGKSKGPEGKAVPLLGFSSWCDSSDSSPALRKALSLTISKPEHPSPKFGL